MLLEFCQVSCGTVLIRNICRYTTDATLKQSKEMMFFRPREQPQGRTLTQRGTHHSPGQFRFPAPYKMNHSCCNGTRLVIHVGLTGLAPQRFISWQYLSSNYSTFLYSLSVHPHINTNLINYSTLILCFANCIALYFNNLVFHSVVVVGNITTTTHSTLRLHLH